MPACPATHYHVQMNITLSLDDDLIASAKALAARNETSVSALVRSALEQQVALDGLAVGHGASGVLQVLLDYAMGLRPRAVAMHALGTDDYGVLLRLLNAAALPHPVVPLARRQQMVSAMRSAVTRTAP